MSWVGVSVQASGWTLDRDDAKGLQCHWSFWFAKASWYIFAWISKEIKKIADQTLCHHGNSNPDESFRLCYCEWVRWRFVRIGGCRPGRFFHADRQMPAFLVDLQISAWVHSWTPQCWIAASWWGWAEKQPSRRQWRFGPYCQKFDSLLTLLAQIRY